MRRAAKSVLGGLSIYALLGLTIPIATFLASAGTGSKWIPGRESFPSLVMIPAGLAVGLLLSKPSEEPRGARLAAAASAGAFGAVLWWLLAPLGGTLLHGAGWSLFGPPSLVSWIGVAAISALVPAWVVAVAYRATTPPLVLASGRAPTRD